MYEVRTAAVAGWVLVCVLAGVETASGELVREGVGQLELLAVAARQGVRHGVEVQATCKD